MDRVWASAPVAALRVWPGPEGRRVVPNAAALAWAADQGLGVDVWAAVAEAVAPAEGAGAEHDLPAGVAPQALRCRWVPLGDGGAVLWVTPLQAGPGNGAGLTLKQPVDVLTARAGLVAEAIGVGFWTRDGDTGAVHWDEQLHRIHGRPLALGAPALGDWIADHVHPDDQAWMQALQDRTQAEWQAVTDASFRLPDRGHGVRWVQTWTRRIVREGRRLAFGMHLDITDRQRADALLRAKQRAEQASRDKSAFMARLSHELRTPMNAVLGFTELLDDDVAEPPSERQRARLQRIRVAGAQLMAMIDDVLDLASLDSEEHAPAASGLPVGDVIGEVVAVLAPLAARHGQQLVVGDVPAAVHLRADRRRVVQALSHGTAQLLRDRGEPGSVRIEARLREGEGGPEVAFEIQLDGAAPAGLFESQAALREPGADGDVGTGLSLARSVVEALGGGLSTGGRAVPGFVLWVPAELAAAPQAGEAPARALTVLCVEDNPVNMLLLRELLSLRPALNMLAAVDGRSGIALGLQGRPDIALLDLQLPDLDGVEVLRRLRGEPSLAHCRFVALSANAMPADIEQALASGFDEYWTKPIDFARFLADIDRLTVAATAVG